MAAVADNVREFAPRGRGRRPPPEPPPDDWRSMLAQRNGRILGDERNVLLALRAAPDLRNLLRLNEFAQVVEFQHPPPWRRACIGERWTDDDDLALQAWLQTEGVEVRQRNAVADSVVAVAKDWIVHPIRDYFDSLKWDGEPRLQIAMADYFGAEGPIDYLALVGTKFMLSAVARVMDPGCQVDHVLVLEGQQGAGKSEAVKALGEPWITDGIPDLHSKDAAIHLAGVWLVEIAELAAMRRSEIEPVKAFITRRVDRFRPLYARRTVDVPRQCVFVATTNEATYLRDPTGNRRFWPVKCGEISVQRLRGDRDQLWAEACHLFQQKTPWHPVGQEIGLCTTEQEARILVTELEQQVAGYLDGLDTGGIEETTTGDVFRYALNINPSQDVERAQRLGRQLAEALHRAGWERIKAVGRGSQRRVIYRKAKPV